MVTINVVGAGAFPRATPYGTAAPMDNRNIGLSLTGDDIPLEAFINAAGELSGLLSELELSVSGARNLDWYVSDLRMGSASLAIRPMPKARYGADCVDTIISAALSGLGMVEKEPMRPDYFTDDALKRAKALAGSVASHTGVIAIFGGGGSMPVQRVPLTRRLAVHVDQLMGTTSVAVGSLEGTLEALSIHGGVEFAIYDAITDRRIRCKCDRETLNQVMEYLGHRLSVGGEVRFNVQGEPMSIKVDSFLPLGRGPLPQAKDMRGLFSDDKVDIDEWSRYVRKQ